MRSDRFTSIAAVIALLATVQIANAATDNGGVYTTTLTRTVYNKPSAVPTSHASVSDFKSRDQNHHKEHSSIVSHSSVAPETITHYITEIHHANPAPSTARPIPISSASPVVIVSASPTFMPSSQVHNGEEVIIKTKTKKNKTKLKTKTISKHSTAMQPVTQSVPLSANPSHTAPATSSMPPLQQPSGSSGMVSKSIMSGPSSMMGPSASPSAGQPMGTPPMASGSMPPPAAAPSSADAIPGMVSMPMSQQQPSASAVLPTLMVVAAPSQPAAAPAPMQSPSIDPGNNSNKKINPPTASAHSANGGASDKAVGPALFLAWLMAAVAAF